MDILNKYDQDGLVAPLENIEGQPVFIHTGMKDTVLPLANQNAQGDLLSIHLKANV